MLVAMIVLLYQSRHDVNSAFYSILIGLSSLEVERYFVLEWCFGGPCDPSIEIIPRPL